MLSDKTVYIINKLLELRDICYDREKYDIAKLLDSLTSEIFKGQERFLEIYSNVNGNGYLDNLYKKLE